MDFVSAREQAAKKRHEKKMTALGASVSRKLNNGIFQEAPTEPDQFAKSSARNRMLPRNKKTNDNGSPEKQLHLNSRCFWGALISDL